MTGFGSANRSRVSALAEEFHKHKQIVIPAVHQVTSSLQDKESMTIV